MVFLFIWTGVLAAVLSIGSRTVADQRMRGHEAWGIAAAVTVISYGLLCVAGVLAAVCGAEAIPKQLFSVILGGLLFAFLRSVPPLFDRHLLRVPQCVAVVAIVLVLGHLAVSIAAIAVGLVTG